MIKKEMIAMLLAGGQGSRLGVLTSKVAKPAVAFGGKYRIIDFPLSNCINSGVDTVGVLTQYQPLRLNTHIGIGIPWDLDRNIGGVTVLPPYEKSTNSEWYTGTANAIYQNLEYMESFNPEYVLILSGDHIYKMDYEVMLEFHKANNAEVTIAVMPVPWEEASRFGIMITDDQKRITDFEEKPANPRSNLASMGIYIFNADAMEEALDNSYTDFGKEIIPKSIKTKKVSSYIFDGYWEDIGTIRSFYEATLDLTTYNPAFNLYNAEEPIYTHMRNLPPSKINGAMIENSLTSEGCVITKATLKRTVIGVRSIIENGTEMDGVITMGADFYETEDEKAENAKKGIPNVGIGKNCKIATTIIDKDARIGDNCQINVSGKKYDDGDHGMFYSTDGIIVIRKGAVIPSGTII